MTTHKSFSARADIESILENRGAVRTDIDVLQPADPFLDTAGEELRRRIFLTQSARGAALCLRPEFTIPVCLKHIADGQSTGRYGYVGTVFRQRDGGASEFLQAGIEDIGHDDVTAADTRSVADSLYCTSALGAKNRGKLILGDQAIFEAVLTDLGLPKGWRVRLTHAFGDENALDAALNRLQQPAKMPDLPDDLTAALESGNRGEIETLIEQHLEVASLLNAGGRDAREIAQRLLAKAQIAKSIPDAGKLEILRRFLSLRVPLIEATDALEVFEHENGLDLGAAIALFAKRNAAFVAAGIDLADAVYSASFGRPLDYYTGLVYEIRDADGTVLAGGGRYDRLLSLLGAKSETKGVGFSIWLDRVAGAST